MTGLLSAFLDNAPTYLVFFNLAGGERSALMDSLQATLAAISMGAVYFGALTYIGNAPNFMIKAIAEDRGVEMPSFFGYFGYTSLVLLPLFAIITWSSLPAIARASADHQDVDAKRAVRAEHDRLLDVAGARRSGDHVHRARHAAVLAADQCERLFHAGDDAVGAQHGDVRVGQQRRRRRRLRAREHDQRAGLGDRAERTGDAEPVVARVGRASIARPAPPSRGPRTRASRRPRRLLHRESRAADERIEIARDGRGNLARDPRAFDGALHVGRALQESGDEVRGHRRSRSLRVRGDVGLRGGARVGARRPLPERASYAREDHVALRNGRRARKRRHEARHVGRYERGPVRRRSCAGGRNAASRATPSRSPHGDAA